MRAAALEPRAEEVRVFASLQEGRGGHLGGLREALRKGAAGAHASSASAGSAGSWGSGGSNLAR
jgi:hypothetical protein